MSARISSASRRIARNFLLPLRRPISPPVCYRAERMPHSSSTQAPALVDLEGVPDETPADRPVPGPTPSVIAPVTREKDAKRLAARLGRRDRGGAQLYPTITLSASWTLQTATAGVPFDTSIFISNLTAGLTTPLFHGGALEAQRRAAIDAFDAQLGDYRITARRRPVRWLLLKQLEQSQQVIALGQLGWTLRRI